MTQAILGAGGDIGSFLARELKNYTDKIRLVARTPKQVNGDDELVVADLLDRSQTSQAVAGASIVYLVVGLKYNIQVWERDWPVLIQNVIQACLEHGSKLVFFDNVYMYEPQAIPHMTESSAIGPKSKKGQVRLHVIEAIERAMKEEGLQALIARSADFYGPDSKNGILNILVLNPIRSGKGANWQANLNKTHPFTYTPDAARATALLGNTESAYQQIWHLPTSAERWTGLDYINFAATCKQIKAKYTLLHPWMIRLAGLFNPTIRELNEMQYQNNQDYFFDSSKFCEAFGFTPTSYRDGIKEVMQIK